MKQLSLPLKYYIRDPKEVFKRFQDMGYFPDYTERAGLYENIPTVFLYVWKILLFCLP